MPKFNVLCRVDAFVDYVAEVEADDAQEAALLAKENSDTYTWAKQGGQEFESTQVGDF